MCCCHQIQNEQTVKCLFFFFFFCSIINRILVQEVCRTFNSVLLPFHTVLSSQELGQRIEEVVISKNTELSFKAQNTKQLKCHLMSEVKTAVICHYSDIR